MVLCFPYDMNTSSVRRKRHGGKQPVNKQLTSYSSSLGKRHRYPSVTYSFISSLTTLFRGILPSFPSPPPSAPFLRTTHGCLAFLIHIFFLSSWNGGCQGCQGLRVQKRLVLYLQRLRCGGGERRRTGQSGEPHPHHPPTRKTRPRECIVPTLTRIRLPRAGLCCLSVGEYDLT